MSKLRVWPISQFGTKQAQTGVSPSLLRCLPCARRIAPMDDARPVRVGHAPTRAAPRPTRISARCCRWGAPEHSLHSPLYSPSLPHPFLARLSPWQCGAPWLPGGAPGWRRCCSSSPLLHLWLALLCL